VSLPLVNPFSTPYEKWSERDATPEEMRQHLEANGFVNTSAKDALLFRVANAFEAAAYMAKVDMDNGLEFSIDRYLDGDPAYAEWTDAMPSPTPPALERYQEEYPECDFAAANQDVRDCGDVLSEGQFLFHAGRWPDGVDSFVTDRPLSTTFCPQVAMRNMDHKAKAHDAGQIDLLVLRAHQPRTLVFAFERRETMMGHEKEVLFATGAELTFRSRTLIKSDYRAAKWNCPDKLIPTYVVEVDIS